MNTIFLKIEKEKLDAALWRITSAIGSVGEPSQISEINDLVISYFEYISKDKSWGGRAELFALSCQYSLCVIVYAGEEGIRNSEFYKMNEFYETDMDPALKFVHSGDHYEPIHSS